MTITEQPPILIKFGHQGFSLKPNYERFLVDGIPRIYSVDELHGKLLDLQRISEGPYHRLAPIWAKITRDDMMDDGELYLFEPPEGEQNEEIAKSSDKNLNKYLIPAVENLSGSLPVVQIRLYPNGNPNILYENRNGQRVGFHITSGSPRSKTAVSFSQFRGGDGLREFYLTSTEPSVVSVLINEMKSPIAAMVFLPSPDLTHLFFAAINPHAVKAIYENALVLK